MTSCEPGRETRCATLALYRVGRAFACDRHVDQLRTARYNRELHLLIMRANPKIYRRELAELAGQAPTLDLAERRLAGVALA